MKKLLIGLLVFVPSFAFAAPVVTIDTPTISVCGTQDVVITGTARFEYGSDADTDYLHITSVGPGPDVTLLSEEHTGDTGIVETINWSLTHSFTSGNKNVQVYIYDDAGHTINEASTYVLFTIDACPTPPDPDPVPPTPDPTPAPAPAVESRSGGGGVGVSYFMWCEELPAMYPKVYPYCLPKPVPPTPEQLLMSAVDELQVAIEQNQYWAIVNTLDKIIRLLESLKA